MASTPTPTVSSLKQSFIAAQTTLLAQPPAPSRAWRAANDASDQPISARVLDDALLALGQTVQQHCRRVYPPQATHHVAEQINSAYLYEAERKVGAEGEVDGAVAKELDLVEDEAIESLPSPWPSEKEANDYPMEAKRYVETVSRLAQLSDQRKELKLRVERLRRLKEIADPFAAGVQDNLITRNGPIELELERMRVLLARVAGRVSELPSPVSGEQPIDIAALTGARKRAIDEFLADPRVFDA
ncbi:hypothetical protein CDD83_5374 [Cordyceps sp. RAO-2017]|nr:hypothetical protein CDD83_5374 [Cordyceps sp. RAO-2017]